MPIKPLAALAALVLGCADQTALGPPRSTDPKSTINNRELEPANGLPRGFTTSHSSAPATGVVGQSTVR